MTKDPRKDFGSMLLNWRRRNRWTQYTACSWAKETGFEAISYGNLSVIEQGKAGELRQKVFFQLEELNLRIKNKKWGHIKDQVLKEKVRQASVLGDEQCPCWGAVEFWSCYVGRREVPDIYKTIAVPTLSEKQVKRLNNLWRYRLKKLIAVNALSLTDVPMNWQCMLLDIQDLDLGEIDLMWCPQKQQYSIDLWLTEIESKQTC